MDTLNNIINNNIESLKNNTYPGRGIIIGMSPNGKKVVQVYWIMGRSENSRNRIFQQEDQFIKNELFNKEKKCDTSLIIYYPIKSINEFHIVSNGDHTNTIYDMLSNGKSYEDAISIRTFEPDKPNFTPRISGVVDMKKMEYKLSIIKTLNNNEEVCLKQNFEYKTFLAGVGHCIHTYAGDGDPIPSYEGEPMLVNIYDDIEETVNYYWRILNKSNRVAILAKYVDVISKEIEYKIINQHKL